MCAATCSRTPRATAPPTKIERCLAIDPARRYRNAEAVAAALKRRAEIIRQKTILYAGLVAPILLLLILGALGWWQTSKTLSESRKALKEQAMKSYITNPNISVLIEAAEMLIPALEEPCLQA